MSRYLTKSRFKLATECPTKLFYTNKPEYKNSLNEDKFLQELANGGFQVGEFAKLLYPDGIEIKSKLHVEAIKQTNEKLENENVVLFEPAISFKNLFIRIDILVKSGNVFELIEVKAKSYDSKNPAIEGARGKIKSDLLPYIQDVAFQKHVLSHAFPDMQISSYLLMPDKSVPAVLDGLNQFFKVKKIGNKTEIIVKDGADVAVAKSRKLLAKVNIDKYIDLVLEQGIEYPGGISLLPDIADSWAESYQNDVRIPPVLHSGCKHCEFRSPADDVLKSGYNECLREKMNLSDSDIDKGTVFDLWNSRRTDKLLEAGLFKPSQLSQEDIGYKVGENGLSNTQRQWMQCHGIPDEYDKNDFFLDTELIKSEMLGWKYPWHMIDFETSTTALPFFEGMRPYESIAFQFSHHVISASGKVSHAGQFLMAEPLKNPNYAFVRALKQALDVDEGTIFRWAAHENTILNHVANQLRADTAPPDDTDELLAFITAVTKDGSRAMVDLNELARRAYYHPDTKARTSIKSVLPAVLKTSKFLKDKYQRPIYGGNDSDTGNIQSLNFKDFSWWQQENDSNPNPYKRLAQIAEDMIGGLKSNTEDSEDLVVAEGGAAATAFARLQFEDISADERERIKNALLRYCELDTLAMVMIVEAWKDWAESDY